jgi:hypothetical protein
MPILGSPANWLPGCIEPDEGGPGQVDPQPDAHLSDGQRACPAPAGGRGHHLA